MTISPVWFTCSDNVSILYGAKGEKVVAHQVREFFASSETACDNRTASQNLEAVNHIEIKGVQLPVIGLGTSGLHGSGCSRIVRIAIELGYRHIDTAQGYGNEADVGAGIRESQRREDVFLATKVWMANLSARDARRTTEDSLRKLKTDYVDLLLVHWPNDNISMEETLDAFVALKEAGKARHIGVSNYTLNHMPKAVALHGAHLLCNQIEYHVRFARAQRRMLDYLRGENMALVAYSPLGRGMLRNDRELKRIGEQYGKSASQIALRWLVEQDNVAVITKFSSEAHGRENMELFDFSLSAEDHTALAALDNGMRVIDPSWGPAWDKA